MKGLKRSAKLRAYSRCCGCVVAMVASVALWTAAPAVAYVPSAIDQYTEQPPAHAGGPGSRAVKGHEGRGNGGSKGSTGVTSAGGTLPPTTGPSAQSDGARSAGHGNAPGSTPKAATTGGESTAETFPVGGYPTTTLLWLALLAIAAAVLARLGIAAARRRHSETSAG